LNVRILGDNGWVGCLTVEESKELLDAKRFPGIATVEQNVRVQPIC